MLGLLCGLVVAAVLVFVVSRWLQRRFGSRILRFLVVGGFLLVSCLALSLGPLLLIDASQSQAVADNLEILDVTVVSRGPLMVSISGSGNIDPARRVPLLFQYSAPVSEIVVDTGEFVEEGAVIARLEATDLDQAVTDAQIALDFQQSIFDALVSPPREIDIAVAEAVVAAASASFGAATMTGTTANDQEIARLRTELALNQRWQAQLQRDAIVDSSTIPLLSAEDIPDPIADNFSADQIDTAVEAANDAIEEVNNQQRSQTAMQRSQAESAILQSEYGIDISEANYRAALSRGADIGQMSSAGAELTRSQVSLDQLLSGPTEFDLRRAEIDLESARLSLELAETNRDTAILYAPFSGVVAQHNLTVGEFPPSNGFAVLLVDNSRYQVDLPIDETDIVNIEVGQRVLLDVDALPDSELIGTVVRVAYTPVQIGQLVTYLVRVELDPTDAPVRIGMSTTARIVIQELDDVLLLRNRFIRIDRATQRAFVTVQDESGRIEEVEVVLGQRNETHSEIVSGLEAGQRVVLVPQGSGG